MNWGVKKKIIVSIYCIFLVSCAQEVYNITVKGVVVDEKSRLPIPNSSVETYCIYQQNIDNTAVFANSFVTDSAGEYNFNFNKGFKISMIVRAEDYNDVLLQFKPQDKNIPDTVFLKKAIIFESSVNKEKTPIRNKNSLD